MKPITQERAQEILDNAKKDRRPGTFTYDRIRDHMAEEEAEYVNKVWHGMPGHTCWTDAFFMILGNQQRDHTS